MTAPLAEEIWYLTLFMSSEFYLTGFGPCAHFQFSVLSVFSFEAVKVTAARLYNNPVFEQTFIFKLVHPEIQS